MYENMEVFVFFLVIDLILLLRIVRLYVNTEVIKAKLLRNRTYYSGPDDVFSVIDKQWTGYTKDGEQVSGWYAVNKYKKIELKEEGTYRNIIYDKKIKIFITTPFKRILVDIAFIVFALPTFFGEVTDEMIVKVIGLLLLLISAIIYGYFRIKPRSNEVTIKTKTKKKRKKKNKFLNYLIPCIFFGAIMIGLIPMFYELQINKFTDEDWNYMYNYIDEEFGNGEHFHVISQDTDIIRKKKRERIDRSTGQVSYIYKTLGINASIIGYFDSQDEIYAIGFSKYLEDNFFYEAGEITLTTVNTNYSKDKYLKDREN